MAQVTLTFTSPINASCQVGDTAYFVNTTTEAEFTVDDASGVTEIGQIREITNRTTNSPTIICESEVPFVQVNTLSRFILFSKDNKANLSSVLGYYAETKFVNNSVSEAEIFSAAMDVFDSSK